MAENGYNYDGTLGGGGAKLARALADSTSTWSNIAFTPSNSSNFSAKPTGYIPDSTFINKGTTAYFRTITPYIRYLNGELATPEIQYQKNNVFELNGSDSPVSTYFADYSAGMSVRCIKNSSDWITDIQIKNLPAKINYIQGEHLDLSGLVVTMTYEDNSSLDLEYSDFKDYGLQCNVADSLVLSGDQNIEIFHSETNRTLSFAITVKVNDDRYGSVTDNEGNTYKTITIGNQEWMVENLRTTQYEDGTVINEITDDDTWGSATTAAYCWYENDKSTAELKNYGALYNYYVIENGNVCPSGWTVPTETDWETLKSYLSDNNYAYTGKKYNSFGNGLGKAMAVETGDWNFSQSTIGDIGYTQSTNNSSGFSGVPSGFRYASGSFTDSAQTEIWWTKSNGLGYYLKHQYSAIGKNQNNETAGNSIRCIKATEDRVISISITKAPEKTNYSTGDSLDLTGLEVRLTRDNGNTEVVKYEDFSKSEYHITPNTGKPLTAEISTVNIEYRPSSAKTNLAVSVVDNFTNGTLTDIDGNTYKTIQIGDQEWMAENLKTVTLNDGTAIENITDQTQWEEIYTPAYCWYDNDLSNKDDLGALYNSYTIETEKLCPAGWHVPVDDEWNDLFKYLENNNLSYDGSTGNNPVSTKKAKALADRYSWEQYSEATVSTNTDIDEGCVSNKISYNNTVGFNAKPAGIRCSSETYYGFKLKDWATYFYSDSYIAYQLIRYSEDVTACSNTIEFDSRTKTKHDGCSVRCIKGELNGGVTFKVTGGSNWKLTFNGNQYNIPYPDGLTIPKVLNGTYDYTISAFKYQTVTGTVTVNDAIEEVNVSMVPAPVYSLTFNFLDEAGDKITDEVSLHSETMGYDLTQSSTNGQIIVYSMPDMDFPYEILTDKYINITDTATLNGSNKVVDIVMKESPKVYTIALRVHDSNTMFTINNAIVTLEGTNYTATDGIVKFNNLTDGKTYDFAIEASGYRGTTQSVTLNSYSGVWEIYLDEAKYDVKFNIKDLDGNVVNNAAITINGSNYTTANGIISVTSLPDGDHSYTITSTGYRDKQGTVSTGYSEQSIDITMVDTNASVYSGTINILDDLGNTISNATLVCETITYTTVNGQITLPYIADGTYSFEVSATGYVTNTGTVTINGADVTQSINLTKDYIAVFNLKDEQGNPIPEATIQLNGTRTTYTGTAKYAGLMQKAYVYTISAPGYHSKSGNFYMYSNYETINLTFIASSISINNLNFNVKDSQGNALIYSTININGTNHQVAVNGNLDLTYLKDGYYNYTVSCDEYVSQSGTVLLNGNDETVNIVLEEIPKYNVSFNVQDESGNPVDAIITFYYSTYTTANGSVSVGDFKQGTYSYTVKADGYNDYTGTLSVNADTEETIVMDSFHSVTVKVKDTEGNPIPGVDLYLYTYPVSVIETTDANGEITVNEIEDGQYEYFIYIDSYDFVGGLASLDEYITVSGADQTLEFTMEYLVVSFNVKDTNGSPLPGAWVNIYGADYYADTSGVITISPAHYGTFSYTVSCQNCNAYSNQIIVNENTVVNVALTQIEEEEDDTYTVTFVNYDGTVLATETVVYGSSATAPESPEREGYAFTGWDTDFSNVTGDITATAQYSPFTNVDNSKESNNIRIYPNPVKDKLSIEVDEEEYFRDINRKILIYNSIGEVVFSSKILQIQLIDVSDLSQGIYIVVVGGVINKIVKE